MGVQKNVGLLKAKNEQVTENLKMLIIEEQKTRELAIGCLELPSEVPLAAYKFLILLITFLLSTPSARRFGIETINWSRILSKKS